MGFCGGTGEKGKPRPLQEVPELFGSWGGPQEKGPAVFPVSYSSLRVCPRCWTEDLRLDVTQVRLSLCPWALLIQAPAVTTMTHLHATNISLMELHLTGIPGLQHLHLWMSIPFCILYLVTLAGNSTLVCLIKADPSLQPPMFLFLSMLAATDLLMSTSIIPQMLGIFWFRSAAISLDACLTQMCFVHAFSVVESGLLVAMAFDRYVAICNPLRYLAILTSPIGCHRLVHLAQGRGFHEPPHLPDSPPAPLQPGSRGPLVLRAHGRAQARLWGCCLQPHLHPLCCHLRGQL